MEGTLAEIRGFGGNFAPRAWAFCEGQLLAISQNQALFSLLGTTYGGDGRNHIWFARFKRSFTDLCRNWTRTLNKKN